MANEIQKTSNANKMTFSAFMTSNAITNRVQSILGDEKTSKRFVSSIISAVSNNDIWRKFFRLLIVSFR